MSKKSTTTPASMNISLNADENRNNSNSSTELIHREQIKNTPFEAIGGEDHGFFIAFGKYRLTEPEDINQERIQEWAKDTIERNKWNIILNLMTIFNEFATMDALNRIEKQKIDQEQLETK